MKKYCKFLLTLIILASSIILTSCDMSVLVPESTIIRTIDNVNIDASTIPAQAIVGTFDITDGDLVISYTDGIVEYIDINTSMLSNEDLAKLDMVGTHSITVNYNGYTTSFSIEIFEEIEENEIIIYDNLQDAISSAPNDSIIKLNKDYIFTKDDNMYEISEGKYAHIYIPENKNITLDLNGHTLGNENFMDENNRYDILLNYGTLKIVDTGEIKGQISANNGDYATSTKAGGFGIISYGDLTLDGITVNGNNVRCYAVYIEGENKKLIVNNSTICGRGGIAIYSGAEAIIDNSNIYLDVETTNERDNAIYVSNSKVTINSGYIDATLNTINEATGKGGNAVLTQGSSTVIVNGGTFDAAESTLHTYTNGTILVYGGTFKQIVKLHQDKQGSILLYGGTFLIDPTPSFIAEGYTVTMNDDNTYSVIKNA